MGTKKDIGKIFKERFKDFEEVPDTATWDNIASELDKTSNRRIAPFWYYIGGILLMGLLGSLWLFSKAGSNNTTPKKIDEVVVNTKKPTNDDQSIKLTSSGINESTSSPKKVSSDTQLETNNLGSTETTTVKTGTSEAREPIKSSAPYDEKTTVAPVTKTPPQQLKKVTSIASEASSKKTINTSSGKTDAVKDSNTIRTTPQKNVVIIESQAFLNQERQTRSASKTKQEIGKKRVAPNHYPSKHLYTVDPTINKEETNKVPEKIIKTKYPEANKETIQRTSENAKKLPTESPEEVAARLAKNQKGQKLASSPKNNAKKNVKTIEEAEDDEAENEPLDGEEIDDNKTSVTKYHIAISPYISIMSYGSLSNGSSIDNQLADNSRASLSTLGYGIRVDYALSERAKLRLGMGYAPLQYRTDDVEVSISNGRANIYQLSAFASQSFSQSSTTSENSPEAIAFFNANAMVSIRQDISYLEIPLELQYNIINKRVNLSISPGISLFLLDNNEIFAISETGKSIFVGKESNLNNFGLGVSFGVGAHYNLNKTWRINMEPVLRYQLNPYNNKLNNFKPYYIGAQFGMSYKF